MKVGYDINERYPVYSICDSEVLRDGEIEITKDLFKRLKKATNAYYKVYSEFVDIIESQDGKVF